MNTLSTVISPENIEQIEALLEAKGPFLSLSQAARKTGIPLQTLSSAVHSGRLAALTMPDNRKYVHLETVLHYLANREEDDSSLAWQRKLLATGLIKEVRPRAMRAAIHEEFDPLSVKGEPLSETIIRERR
jgi:hypothetical protein